MIRSEFEIIADYATGNGAPDVNFSDYIQGKKLDELYENCVNCEHEDPMQLMSGQIDMSLDLLSVARVLQDREWEGQLIQRLQALSRNREKLTVRRSAG